MTTERYDLSDAAVAPAEAIRLVLGVARLGERDLAEWWSSQGMNPDVGFALAGFRRTKNVVGAELALLSAMRRHDQILPRRSAVHLFSAHLPFMGWTTAYLAELKSIGGSDLIDELRTWKSMDLAAATLGEWLAEADLPSYDGRTAVTQEDLSRPTLVAMLLSGFVGGYIALPELDVPYVDLVS